MAAAPLAWGEAQPGKAPAGSRGPRGVWGSPGLPHSILPHLPCTCLAPHGSSQLPLPPHLLAQPVNAACARRPLLLPSPVLCAPCVGHGLPRARPASARESTAALKAWLGQHLRHPYPSKGEKVTLALISNMSLTQVSTWFANARRRLRKEKRSWAPRSDAGKGEAGSLGTGCSPRESSPGPCPEPAPRRPSPQPHTAVLAQEKPPRIWCLAEIATAPRPALSLRRGAARPCWGQRVPESAARAVYVLPPRLGLGLGLPWGTKSCPAPPLCSLGIAAGLDPGTGGTEESLGVGEAGREGGGSRVKTEAVG